MTDKLELYKKMSELEEGYAEALEATARELRNPLIRVIIKAVAEDSIKHSLIYKAIVELIEGPGPMLSEEEADAIAKEIERHIKVEEEMIKSLSKILELGVDNKAIGFLIKAILKDEHYHHALLKRVYDMIVLRETLTESEMWDLIWKDALYHGTPGG